MISHNFFQYIGVFILKLTIPVRNGIQPVLFVFITIHAIKNISLGLLGMVSVFLASANKLKLVSSIA